MKNHTKDNIIVGCFTLAITLTALVIGLAAYGFFEGLYWIMLTVPCWMICTVLLLERFPRKTDKDTDD